MSNLLTLALASDYTSDKLTDRLSAIIAESCGELRHAALRDDDDYRQQSAERERLFEEIRSKLGENEHLMYDHENIVNFMQLDELCLAYIQGFIDCMSLLKLRKEACQNR